MLSIKDVVSLAKAGYKPADVKELIEMSKEVPEEPAPVAPEVKPEATTPEEAPATVTTAAGEKEKEPEIDYKAKYNELLEANRKAALARDNSGSEPQQKSAEEIVNEALIGLLS
jgi:hypothetical protein